MPVFNYKGFTKSEKSVKGTVEAENKKIAQAKLKREGIFITEIKDKRLASKRGRKSEFFLQKKVNIKDMSLMTRQLASLIKANIPLVDALAILAEQLEHPVLKETISDCKSMVMEGNSFYHSLSKYPRIFNKIYISMCQAGEMSGSLDVILNRLAEFTESQSELQSKVKSTLAYPIILLIITLGILSVIFLFVIPKMVTIFESSPDLTLPFITVAIIGISNFFINYWFIVGIGAVVGFFSFKNWRKTSAGQVYWDKIQLKLPLFGSLIKMVAISRFTRTLSTLLNGGVPMLEALSISKNVIENILIEKAVEHARSNISEGESIASPLKNSGQFPSLVTNMIHIGEQTGDLERMLTQLSDTYDFQVKAKVDSLTSMMGPLITVIMGVVVAIIVFSVMIPMMEMTNLAG